MKLGTVIGGAVAVVAVAGLGAAVWFATTPGPIAFAKGETVALASYRAGAPTGVPAELAGADIVRRGEYLTQAADCEVCHTAIGGAPYAGGFAVNLPFGTLYSTNITPDPETGIGRYTDAEFIDAVRHGKRKDGAQLYPAMPYPSYRYMTDDDALAIKAYLFSLAPVQAPAKENTLGFPFNQRGLMGVWNAVFSRPADFEPHTERTPEWNRGAYLVEAMAHCGDCHTPRNPGFAVDNRAKFKGAVAGGWRAYNITSSKTSGVGDWSDAQLFSYLSNGHAEGKGSASGPMGEVADYSLAHLTPGDVRAMVAYVRSIPAIDAGPAPKREAASEWTASGAGVGSRGEALFAAACMACHDWTGVSPVMSYATLVGARAVNDPNATNVAQAIIHGVHRTAPGAASMPSFGDAYGDDEIAALANYVTGRFGMRGSQLSEKDVANLRKQTAQ